MIVLAMGTGDFLVAVGDRVRLDFFTSYRQTPVAVSRDPSNTLFIYNTGHDPDNLRPYRILGISNAIFLLERWPTGACQLNYITM